jgi:hypothetical protein
MSGSGPGRNRHGLIMTAVFDGRLDWRNFSEQRCEPSWSGLSGEFDEEILTASLIGMTRHKLRPSVQVRADGSVAGSFS